MDRAVVEPESIILSRSVLIFKAMGVKGIVPGEYEKNKDKFSLKIKEITREKKFVRQMMKDGQKNRKKHLGLAVPLISCVTRALYLTAESQFCPFKITGMSTH